MNGEHEPTDDECQLPLVHGLSQEELQKLEENAPVEGVPSKGVPGFWYYVLSNTTQISDMIFEYDTAILKHLIDITTEVHSSPPVSCSLKYFACFMDFYKVDLCYYDCTKFWYAKINLKDTS